MLEGLARLNWRFILEVGLGVFGARVTYACFEWLVWRHVGVDVVVRP
jgi:hypothetical protein